jgi:hypothetical protein
MTNRARSFTIWTHPSRPHSRRWKLKLPKFNSEETFGFFFRFAVGIASVLLGFALLCVIGLLNGWKLHGWMIFSYGLLISIMVFFAEIIRVALFERITQNGDDNILALDVNSLRSIADSKRGTDARLVNSVRPAPLRHPNAL